MKEERVIPNEFDVVIMNPSFTRRECIPATRDDLERLVPDVKGKTGYWAYFMVAADKLLKENGTLAVVIPEEFFVGGGAKSVRDYILRRYCPSFIIRSGVEIAFSESVLYKDYLVVFKKEKLSTPLTVAVLKKKLADIQPHIEEVGREIKKFALSLDQMIFKEEFDAVKFPEIDVLLSHKHNLKPLVGFNTIKAQMLALQLLKEIKEKPTLRELRERGTIKLRLYRPKQFKIKGVERYAEKLFSNKYLEFLEIFGEVLGLDSSAFLGVL